MRKKLILATVVTIVLALAACTQQQRARVFGGTANVELPECRKLVVVTWRDANLWYLTKQMTKADIAEEYHFAESSSFGLIEGTVKIREKKGTACS